jgi:hypothetical protein
MNRGRPRATGPFETHAELVAAVLDRHDQGQKYARHCPYPRLERTNHNQNYQGEPITMKPTRSDILQAWLTLQKVRETYSQDRLDEADKMMLIDVMKLLDELQQEEARR